MNEDGTMSRMPQLEIFSKEHNIPIVQVADLIHHRLQRERLVERMGERMVETRWGRFRGVAYRSTIGETEMTALCLGDRTKNLPVSSESMQGDNGTICLVAIHGEPNQTWISPSRRLRRKAQAFCSIWRPVHVGLTEAFTGGEHPPSAENLRTVGLGAQVLLDLGIHRMRLITPPSTGGRTQWL